ncbi:ROK family protein [Rhizobium laguerreae]|uniref:ROK family transcriptional regulator n=1 Tax=Rhizobium laguerreae TaxID=1076926 RepID=UPI00143F2E87|nr:ROK family transcriptional regulator [Rhizobium laguerreae]NKM88633.1 ROK family protein [Rhizobium laguerreae]
MQPIPSLTDSARAVLKMIANGGPVTRPQLSAALAFSKPAMSSAVGELEAYGLVASQGLWKGPLGRSAVTYGLGPRAGYVIGLDCGTTQINAVASMLDGHRFFETETSLDDRSTDSDLSRFPMVRRVVEAVIAQCGTKGGPLRAITIALPNIISRSMERLADKGGIFAMLEGLYGACGVPILLENNVNCAALAEYHEGAAKDHAFVVYLQIGVKIGVGIVVDGKLFRGFRGGAGEISHMAFPWSQTERPVFQGLEKYLGSVELIGRCRTGWPMREGAPPETTAELFARAETSQYARACVDRHAADVGRLVATFVSVLDPQLVVLGGGVGQNMILTKGVEKVVEELCWPVEIAVSHLPRKATVLGAVRLAIDFAVGGLLGEDRGAVFVYDAG